MEVRAEFFWSYVSHTDFFKNHYNRNRTCTSLNEIHPDGVCNPPDEAMTILKLPVPHQSGAAQSGRVIKLTA